MAYPHIAAETLQQVPVSALVRHCNYAVRFKRYYLSPLQPHIRAIEVLYRLLRLTLRHLLCEMYAGISNIPDNYRIIEPAELTHISVGPSPLNPWIFQGIGANLSEERVLKSAEFTPRSLLRVQPSLRLGSPCKSK